MRVLGQEVRLCLDDRIAPVADSCDFVEHGVNLGSGGHELEIDPERARFTGSDVLQAVFLLFDVPGVGIVGAGLQAGDVALTFGIGVLP